MTRPGQLRQPWLHSARFDSAFILGPALLVTAAVLMFSDAVQRLDTVPPWLWVALIVGVDVSHVYSSLYRTYFDSVEFRARQTLYTAVPAIALLTGVVLYSLDSGLFWRVLTYLAVFHFVRQQYGFMMMYKRGEPSLGRWQHRIDQALIYLAPIYPLVYWHCHSREFRWFIDGDFLQIPFAWPSTIVGALYIGALVAYLVKEIVLFRQTHFFNLPRNGLLLGTALSWYVGIIAFNNDLAFTATNVIAHGIPYMALIWLYRRNARDRLESFSQSSWSLLFTPIYLLSIGVVAYVEETLWDGLVWREHAPVLPLATWLPQVTDITLLALLVPLLTVPQATHYILDAYIWRLRTPGSNWKAILFRNDAPSAPNHPVPIRIEQSKI